MAIEIVDLPTKDGDCPVRKHVSLPEGILIFNEHIMGMAILREYVAMGIVHGMFHLVGISLGYS